VRDLHLLQRRASSSCSTTNTSILVDEAPSARGVQARDRRFEVHRSKIGPVSICLICWLMSMSAGSGTASREGPGNGEPWIVCCGIGCVMSKSVMPQPVIRARRPRSGAMDAPRHLYVGLARPAMSRREARSNSSGAEVALPPTGSGRGPRRCPRHVRCKRPGVVLGLAIHLDVSLKMSSAHPYGSARRRRSC